MIGGDNIIKAEVIETDLENSPADPSSLNPPDNHQEN